MGIFLVFFFSLDNLKIIFEIRINTFLGDIISNTFIMLFL